MTAMFNIETGGGLLYQIENILQQIMNEIYSKSPKMEDLGGEDLSP